MATPSHCGPVPGGKTDVAKTDKKGSLGRRNALNNAPNSRKPSARHSVIRDGSVNVNCIEEDPCAVKGKLSKFSKKKEKRKGKLSKAPEEWEDELVCSHNHWGCIKSEEEVAQQMELELEDMMSFLENVETDYFDPVELENTLVWLNTSRATRGWIPPPPSRKNT